MLQVENLILYIFLLVLGISLNFSPDTDYKQSRFSNTMFKKDFEFISNKKDGIILFNLGFVLLLAEVDPILEEQSHKRHALMAFGTGRIKIILALLIEVLALYMLVSIT